MGWTGPDRTAHPFLIQIDAYVSGSGRLVISYGKESGYGLTPYLLHNQFVASNHTHHSFYVNADKTLTKV